MSLTAKQLEERLDYICGSDAATICGISPYGDKIKLWQEKTRQIHAEDISDKPYIKAGNFLEPAVRAWFEKETGMTVTLDPKLIVHKDIAYMAGNIDGWVGDDAIFEAKTASFDTGWGEQGDNTIPDHYLCQVSHYMAVCDVKRAYVAVLIRGNDFRHYVIDRNYKLEEMLLRTQKSFWDCVRTRVAPRPASGAEVISLHGYKSIEEPVVANGDIQQDLIQLEKVKQTIKKLDSQKSELEDKIKIFMGQNDTLLSQSGKIAVTWKSAKSTKRFDSASLKEDDVETYSKYVKEFSASRRFILKTNEGLEL
jgi:putative phage-type endonuclease